MPEYFDVVNNDDRVIGTTTRKEAHGNPKQIHRVAHVLVFNRKGELFLQKRSRNKDVQPGKWDSSVGGHLDRGECYRDAALREAAEELGIRDPELKFLYKYLHRNDYEAEYVSTFSCVYDGPIQVLQSEIEAGQFWNLDDIDAESSKGIFTPNFLEELKRYRDYQTSRRDKDGLRLRNIEKHSDIKDLAQFNAAVHGEETIGTMTELLIRRHPDTRKEHWLFIEDGNKERIASALCLIPRCLSYCGIEIKTAEMGIAGTLPEYRNQGLVRRLNSRFFELALEGDYLLSIIQGIPYFYRQFGYRSAVELIPDRRIEYHQLSFPPGIMKKVSIRKARRSDIPELERLYNERINFLDISTKRKKETWEYLLGPSLKTEYAAETWLVSEKHAGGRPEPIGYFRIQKKGFGPGLIVNEASRMERGTAAAVLDKLKKLGLERRKPYIKLELEEASDLVKTAQVLGAKQYGAYAWQIKVIDTGKFLHRISPVLENRLAESPFRGLSGTLKYNCYRCAWDILIENGKISSVTPAERGKKASAKSDREKTWQLCIPPEESVSLLIGWKSWQELSEFCMDLRVSTEIAGIQDVLFPKLDSFLYTNY
jgi:isopentenyldiphosphate isomerase